MTMPCQTCTTGADCATCPAYDSWLASTEPPAPRPCPTCSEVEWLLLSGEAFAQIPGQLHKTRAAVERHLHRHGRPDLAVVPT